ncbi:uncharacterized protein LOC142588582 [Dermacentor variabilis]|uniref:uncharacterized protein LOC142588582 n=1 Tax=Dermacentor variabilis TaxID=34621 RepID=UPI003F5C96B6
MDDILLWGRTKEKQGHHLSLLLARCLENYFKLNLKERTFLQADVRYLGHILSTEGLRLDPGRANEILEMKEPKNSKELQVFLGMMNYVQRFIPNMFVMNASLRTLLRIDIAWVWTEAQQ